MPPHRDKLEQPLRRPIVSGPFTAWQVYTGPISVAVDKNGTASFDYYSVDIANNTETTHTDVLQ